MIIKLPDGTEKNYDKIVTVKEVINDISPGLARVALGAVVNEKVLGMQDEIEEDCDFRAVKFEDLEGKKIFWHTSSHIMAYAVQRLYGDVAFGIGPATDNGFYYDMELEHRFVPEDLENIEKEMKAIIKENYPIEKVRITREDAIEYFKERNQKYKVRIVEDIPMGTKLTLYKIGDFADLCRGPHLESTKLVKSVKLLSIAGAYWRGNEKNEMLQRIYGISFEKKKQLDEFIQLREEAEKRDHRKLAKEMDIFSMHQEGPGFPFFHPNGMIIKNALINWIRDLMLKNGYGEIQTPIILNESLWKRSGHWDHYKENMYFTKIDGEDYAIKPMNCPGASLVYKTNSHSYRELPIRLSEFGLDHRHELSGALHGLFRVRAFTQDDAHIFCRLDQIKQEVFNIIDLAKHIYSVFGFKYSIELSTRPEDYMGTLEEWNKAEEDLKRALEEKGMEYSLNEGDGAFYGPKIDFHLEDAIGRSWQCGTIQLDFQMPQNFDLSYINKEGEKSRPVMIHRALFGSVERFLGILIEHYAGKFPMWLSPTQIVIIPVSEKYVDFAEEVYKKLVDANFRVKFDDRAEKVGYKIREAQMDKINYMLVIGEKEKETNLFNIRERNGKEQDKVKLEDFIVNLNKEIEEKEYRG